MTDSRLGTATENALAVRLGRLVTIEPGEMRATLFSFAFFFFLLASYFILRSIRLFRHFPVECPYCCDKGDQCC